VRLTYEQFRYAFANAVGEEEAKELYETFAVPAPGAPLFQAASANLNPWTEAKVDTRNPDRGPLLIISGDSDHTVPWAIASASFKKQQRNDGVTEIVELPDRGHALTIDAGWRTVADTALAFVKRFVWRINENAASEARLWGRRPSRWAISRGVGRGRHNSPTAAPPAEARRLVRATHPISPSQPTTPKEQ
jgi:hypothetical protein